MARLPLPPITDFEAYNKNTKEQYDALGRFVVAFEGMVSETRNCCTELLEHNDFGTGLVDVAFHHPALTAKPLFEIYRALVMEFVGIPFLDVKEHDQNIFRGVFKTISTEYFELVNTRNTLLHGTWLIGYSTPEDPNSENFFLHKFKPTSTGLQQADVPKHAFELLKLTDRCGDTRAWIWGIHSCIPRPNRPFNPITETFSFRNGDWYLDNGFTFEGETLPRKSP